MKSHHQIAGLSGLAATLLVLAGTWTFASMRPDYSHISHTISELGESGTPMAGIVSFGLFLSTGLLVWLAIYLAYPLYSSERLTSTGLLAFASLGLGYVIAAFFPCDPGSPLIGSWRQQVHNLFGLVEYLGTGVGFMAIGFSHVRANSTTAGMALIVSGSAVLVGLVLLSIPSLFGVRGLVQRLAELIIFGWLAFASLSLIFRSSRRAPGTEGA